MIDKTSNFSIDIIKSNISKYGHHINMVVGGAVPRFAYTIGVNQKVGFEMILAGASFYSIDEVKLIINEIVEKLKLNTSLEEFSIEIDSLGTFSLRKVDVSWMNSLMLGVRDFYKSIEISALQIVPDQEHQTIDIPNLSQPWTISLEPVWQWVYKTWEYSVEEQSIAVTNLDALRGKIITEGMRWESEEWELFSGAGPDTPQEELRKVPLGTLLAIDTSLDIVSNLEIGKGVWRDPVELTWHLWGSN